MYLAEQSCCALYLKTDLNVIRLKFTKHYSQLDVTPDGRRVILSGGGTISLWDIESGACLRTLENQPDNFSCLSVAPDGKHALLKNDGKMMLCLWNLQNGKLINIYPFRCDSISSCNFSPSGTEIVCGTLNGNIFFFSLENIECAPPLLTAISSKKARCPLCAAEFVPPNDVVAWITNYSKNVENNEGDVSYIAPPAEAFEDPRLLADCPECGGTLRFNPFFAFSLGCERG